jgi:hypothetical protein
VVTVYGKVFVLFCDECLEERAFWLIVRCFSGSFERLTATKRLENQLNFTGELVCSKQTSTFSVSNNVVGIMPGKALDFEC